MRHIANSPECRAQRDHLQALEAWARRQHLSDPTDSLANRMAALPFDEGINYEPISLPIRAPLLAPPRKATMQDCPDIDDCLDDEAYAKGTRYARRHPNHRAGKPIQPKRTGTTFEKKRQEQKRNGLPVYHPFASMAEWELARWAIKHLGHGEMDGMLALDAVSLTLCP